MAQPRRKSTSRPHAEPRSGLSWGGSAVATLTPDLSSRGVLRLAVRVAVACLSIAVVSTFAHWSSTGFLDRGGLDRLVSMKNTPDQPIVADAKRGGLDRGRLKAVISGSVGPSGR